MNDRTDDRTYASQMAATGEDSWRCFERDVMPFASYLRRAALGYTRNQPDAEEPGLAPALRQHSRQASRIRLPGPRCDQC